MLCKLAVIVCAGVVAASISARREGWLDRVVAHFKSQFVEDARTLPPVQIKATLSKAPPGYIDSKEWNYDSAVRLLTLLSQNKAARPVLRAIRRSFHDSLPARRYYMDRETSYKYFPKLPGVVDYYSDSDDSHERGAPPLPPNYIPDRPNYAPGWPRPYQNFTEDSVVVVSNPVESRLPSAHISVAMLKEILMARALAGRVMPSTTMKPIVWKKVNRTNATTTTEAAVEAEEKGGNSTNASEEETSSTVAEEGAKTEGEESGK